MRILSSKKLATLISALLVVWVVVGMYLQRDIGLADNGDFTSAIKLFTSGPVGFEPNWPPAGTEDWNQRFFHFWIPRWKLDWPLGRPTSSAVALWLPGVALNHLLYSREVLYFPIVSLFPKVLLLASFVLLFRWIDASNLARRAVLCIALGAPMALMLTTTDYIAYLNSFYRETASLVFLFLTLASFLFLNQRPQSTLRFLVCLAAVLLLATAKPSSVYWPLVACPLLFYLRDERNGRADYSALLKGLGIGLALMLALLLSVLIYASRQSKVYSYHSLFYGALTWSDHPSTHLAELGMKDGLECIGQSAYSPIGSECVSRYERKLSYLNTVQVIFREPIVMFRMIGHAADRMQDISIEHLGKYSFDDPRAQSHTYDILPGAEEQRLRDSAVDTPLDLWTTLKFKFFPIGYALGIVLFLYLCLFVHGFRRAGFYRALSIPGLLTTIACPIDMLVALLGDGRRELIKHLFLANVLFDVASIACLGLLLCLAFGIIRARSSRAPELL